MGSSRSANQPEEASATEVDDSVAISDVQGLTAIGFDPPARATGFQRSVG